MIYTRNVKHTTGIIGEDDSVRSQCIWLPNLHSLGNYKLIVAHRAQTVDKRQSLPVAAVLAAVVPPEVIRLGGSAG